MGMTDRPIKNWIPYKLVNRDGEIQCHWLNSFDKQFAEPFFDETIIKLKGLNSEHAGISSVSDLTVFEDWSRGLDAVEPSAFIFHISRCGSTLVSQLLTAPDTHIVLPEVPFFDDLLRLPYQHKDFDAKTSSRLLTVAMKYYGQKRTGQEEHLFVKTDSWHMFFYEQLRQLYPNTPFVLMYRNPNEVFSSLKRMAGLQAVPGLIEPAIFGFGADEEVPQAQDLYIAQVLERYLQQYLKIIANDSKFLLLNYSEGPMPMIKKIAAFTHTDLSPQDMATMEERSRYHSKKPDAVFSEPDAAPIPQCLHKAIELYDELEKIRLAV
jgi:hypothetical protein